MAALNALGDAVAASFKEWLGESAVPPTKRHASADSSSAASEQPSAHGKRLGKGQSSNPSRLGRTSGCGGPFRHHFVPSASMSMLGWILWRRGLALWSGLQQLAGGLEERRHEAVSIKAMLEADVDKRDKLGKALQESLEQLRSEVEECKQVRTSVSTSASGYGGVAVTSAVVIGSLGWNATAEQLIERAKPLMVDALPDLHASLPLVPIVNQKGEGNAVETLLPTSMVPEARVRVKAMRRSLPGAKGCVWLDHRRSMRDATTARMIHKLCEAVVELEEQRADAHTIVKKVAARQLWTQNGQRVAWLHSLRVCWSSWASSRYQAVDMDSAASYAEGS